MQSAREIERRYPENADEFFEKASGFCSGFGHCGTEDTRLETNVEHDLELLSAHVPLIDPELNQQLV